MSTACVKSSPALRPTLGEKVWDDICVRSRTQTLPVSWPSEAALSLSEPRRAAASKCALGAEGVALYRFTTRWPVKNGYFRSNAVETNMTPIKTLATLLGSFERSGK